MEYSILKKEKTWANIKVQNRASQANPHKVSADKKHRPTKRGPKKSRNRRSRKEQVMKKESFSEIGFQKALALNP